MKRFVVLSGCSGGGKSTLLTELQSRGHAVVEEPGRRVIAQERSRGGAALPWIDLAAFAERAIEMSLADRDNAMGSPGFVFFDRGLIDAVVALEYASGRPSLHRAASHRYRSRVFFTPPWPELFVSDAERRHGWDDALAEYERLQRGFASLDYAIEVLPKAGVAERADIVLAGLREEWPS